MEGTVGRLLIDRSLPADMRGRPGALDNKGLTSLLEELAKRSPDDYKRTVKRLMDVGREVSFLSGGYSFGLSDILPSPEVEARRQELRDTVKSILRTPGLSETERNKRVVDAVESVKADLENITYESAKKSNNPLAMQVMTGTRGKPANLQGIMAGEGLYADHQDRPIPYPVLRGFAEGLSPAEYFAGSFGARKSIFDVKAGTAQAGYYGKMLNRATHRLVVTALDAEDPNSLSQRGIPVDTDDPDNDGSLLGMPAGGYPRNTPLTPAVLKDLKARGIKNIIVRSPIASGPADGGVYAKDLGYREHGKGKLSTIAEAVGLAASQAISEPVSQSSLSSKHTGGVLGAGPSGFHVLEQLTTSPSESPYWASHANKDGVVSSIKPSPTGGHLIYIDGEEHAVSPGLEPSVQIGQRVEAGDQLSGGLTNAALVVHHKGVGEGRRAWMQSFMKSLKDNGIKAHRRNVELLARGLVNHIEATDDFGSYLPGDVVPYDRLEADWKPRAGSVELTPKMARNLYLERPVLHYTLGTRVTPSVAANLEQFGIKNVLAHHETPPFQPTMIGGRDTLFYDPDWQTRMYGSQLQKATLRGAWEGAESDEHGTSFVPGLARGIDFGTKGKILRPGLPVDDKPPKL